MGFVGRWEVRGLRFGWRWSGGGRGESVREVSGWLCVGGFLLFIFVLFSFVSFFPPPPLFFSFAFLLVCDGV